MFSEGNINIACISLSPSTFEVLFVPGRLFTQHACPLANPRVILMQLNTFRPGGCPVQPLLSSLVIVKRSARGQTEGSCSGRKVWLSTRVDNNPTFFENHRYFVTPSFAMKCNAHTHKCNTHTQATCIPEVRLLINLTRRLLVVQCLSSHHVTYCSSCTWTSGDSSWCLPVSVQSNNELARPINICPHLKSFSFFLSVQSIEIYVEIRYSYIFLGVFYFHCNIILSCLRHISINWPCFCYLHNTQKSASIKTQLKGRQYWMRTLLPPPLRFTSKLALRVIQVITWITHEHVSVWRPSEYVDDQSHICTERASRDKDEEDYLNMCVIAFCGRKHLHSLYNTDQQSDIICP